MNSAPTHVVLHRSSILDLTLDRFADRPTRRIVLETARFDPALAAHCAAVAELSVSIAAEVRLSPQRTHVLARAALLHDVGKRFVPQEVLGKPTSLEAHERRIVEGHVLTGVDLLRSAGMLAEATIIRHHHERWDGGGYPDRLRAAEIPVEARIIMAADTYDAMTSDRPYRRTLSHAEACDELAAIAGSQLDPECVLALLAVVRRG